MNNFSRCCKRHICLQRGDSLSPPPSLTEVLPNSNKSSTCTMKPLKFHSTLAGKISPFLHSLLLSRDDLHAIATNVSNMLHVIDLSVLIVLGWMLVPATAAVYSFAQSVNGGGKVVQSERKKGGDDLDGEEDAEEGDGTTKYQRSYVCLLADHLSQMARLALLVYACDCIVSIVA